MNAIAIKPWSTAFGEVMWYAAFPDGTQTTLVDHRATAIEYAWAIERRYFRGAGMLIYPKESVPCHA